MYSCKNQDYPNLELVISDDDSKDSTIDLINKYTCDFLFPVRIFFHNPEGIGANWNNCIRYANGKYIKFLFQDDLLEPNCISKLVDLIESQPNVALAGCKRKIIIEKSSSKNDNWLLKYHDLQKTLKRNVDGIYSLSKQDFNISFFYEGALNKIGEPSTVLLNRECLISVGSFREDLNQVLDLEFCWRLMEKHTILISSEYLCWFRLHDKQSTNVNRSNYRNDYLKIKYLIFTKYIWKMPIKESFKIILKELVLMKKILFRYILGRKNVKLSNGGS